MRLISSNSRKQRGYALVALLALMTILLLFVMAAVPRIKQQAQRELEIEAISRGEQVAEAIRLYMHYKNGELPTSMEDLLDGIPAGSKRIQILRPSAARDPLSESGRWRLIAIDNPSMLHLQRAITEYCGGVMPTTHDPLLGAYWLHLRSFASMSLTDTVKDDISSSTGPFLGVASTSTRKSVLTYYGIEQHNQWVFTPLYR